MTSSSPRCGCWSSRRWRTGRSGCPAGSTTSRAGSPTRPSWPRCARRSPRPARCTLSYVGAPGGAGAEGLGLAAAARQAGLPVGELVCELVAASDTGAGCVFGHPPTNTDADIRTLLRYEAHMAGSDGILLGSRPHPRAWGTFARLLARHTRELGDWTSGQAAVHLAGHPARRGAL